MCRVRLYANAIEHQHIEIAKTGKRVGRNRFEIGRVCKIVKAICNDRQLAVDDFERCDLEIVTNAERRIVHDRVRHELWQAAAEMGGIKNVLEYSPQVRPRNLVSVNAHGAVTKIERANVVEAEHMIDVAMCYENSVEMTNTGPERLLTEIDRRIDEDLFIAVLDQYRNPQPLVTRVVGQTRLTIARDRGHTSGSSGSEKCELHKKVWEVLKVLKVLEDILDFLDFQDFQDCLAFLPENIVAGEFCRGLCF